MDNEELEKLLNVLDAANVLEFSMENSDFKIKLKFKKMDEPVSFTYEQKDIEQKNIEADLEKTEYWSA